MKTVLSRQPWFVLLLPLFFVFHGFAGNFHYLSIIDVLSLAGMYMGASVLVYLIIRLPLRNNIRAGLFAVFLMAFFFFFGFLFDTLKAYAPYRWMYKYSVLLSAFLVIAIILFIYLLRTKREFGNTAFYLNLLLIFYLLFDMGAILYKGIFDPNANEKITASGAARIPEGKPKPDIYLLLFDEYAGDLSLRQWMNYDNSANSNFLRSRGFFVAKAPFSNYKYTVFSMASMLNMDFISWYIENKKPSREDLVNCGTLVKHSEVTKFLAANGYEIVNNSIFDIDKYPAHINQRFLPVNTRLISEETLIYRLSVDFEWWLRKQPVLKKLLPVETREDEMMNIERAIDFTMKEPSRESGRPKFVYSHFMVPHLPNFFDCTGKRLSYEQSRFSSFLKGHYDQYLNNLQFANNLIRKLVTNIQQQTGNRAVIIVMSDHGLRKPWHPSQPCLENNNMNAIFLPGQQYDGWTDSTTNVNQFRILFNTLFDQQYKLLPDSCIKMGHE
ncbi:sulfatase-like hydrolase/transferase [Pseudobacter ginsenosidimutans]|uniref:Sulfatase-like protein n=1 Tax=Pseudobacter ginsenosidimutans TaxID=661488 RepID=A0A4Q7MCE4_9BACT|nr:sulfatase-like hydrolase/transferase [Pseudobacter ginsenosidimutans]QEC42775.1 sulfatase-like hydrolase/transferase [Pseudobacter ginsenosidimutans]RZS65067.1 sulfatase-like protein [Pseudobacter ginsenosidimutans]